MAKNYHRWIVAEFKNFLKGEVAEVGAGSGNFSQFLLENSNLKKLTSFEPDKNACLLYQKNIQDPRTKIVSDFFTGADYPNRFDTVVYTNVLEHVENDEQELISVYQSLKKGGRICIFVPALPFLYSEHDKIIGHFRRYTKGQLKKVLTDAGFTVEKIKYKDIFGIITWLVMYKVLRREPNPHNVGFYDQVIVPFCKIFESFIPPFIGKNLVAIAKK